MQKTRIDIRANLVAYADACEVAQLEVKDRCDNLSDVADNNKKDKMNSLNIRLIAFGIQIQSSLADNIRKTWHKWAIDNLTEGRHNNLITSLILNIRAEISTHIEDFLTICQCQVDEFDCLSINDIDQISTDVIISWQEIICYGG